MDIARPVNSSVSSISFSFLSTEDVRRISVKQIVNPVLLDNLGQPNIGGLYDPALGPSTNREICATCRLDYFQCPGHFGHIELPGPVYHPLFLMTVYKLLRCTCLFCHHFKVSRIQVVKAIAKLKLLERGLMDAAKALDDTSFTESGGKGSEDQKENANEEVIIKKLMLYVKYTLERAPHAKRGEYKDGSVFQTRKAAIEEFMAIALGSAKKCQRKHCGAPAYTFRKDGHTKIVEYDLTPKQKLLVDHAGLKRPDIHAYDRAIHAQPSKQRDLPASSNSGSGSESDMENEENIADDDAMDTDEGEGDDTAETTTAGATVARTAGGKVKGARGRNERVLTPSEVRAHLRWLFRNEAEICSLIFGRQGPYSPISPSGLSPVSADMFFLDVIAVSPTRFRPASKMGDKFFEHPHNDQLAKVLNRTYTLRDLSDQMKEMTAKGASSTSEEQNRVFGKMLDALIAMQSEVNAFIDSSKSTAIVRSGKLAPPGVKQGLEKKEGLFRMHMMGKRVNYAARSVISPDVNIETNEIGVPPVFARKLTFAEPVTHHNVTGLRELVIRGPTEHPGARAVQMEDGTIQSLDKLSLEQRTAIANQLLTPHETQKASGVLRPKAPITGKKVLRHLRDGDILILNRQPTLHKPSMMAHKAKVLQGEKTIRMHYANCNSYNADFDGDEMNIHFPQGQISRSEAMSLANTDNQYLVPTSGKPLRGLIQDHVVGGLWLTNKSTFFTREEYQQLLYGALRPEDNYTGNGRVITLPPAIIKPQPLWTGKQIISTILHNITPQNRSPLTMKSNAQVKDGSWGRPKASLPAELADEEQKRLAKGLSEDRVLVLGGDLVRGVLDKSQFGAASYGLVHSVYEVYGAEAAGRLLSIFSRLFTKYLQHRAFTCRMDDLALTPEGEIARKKAMESGEGFGTEAAISFFSDMPKTSSKDKKELEKELNGRLEKVLRDGAQMAGLDNIVKGKMTQLFEAVVGATIPGGLLKPFPHNHMQAMTTSGAKGSATNARQISALLGQQELESRRVPVMVSGKTLPAFRAFETAAIAGGYVGSRFLTGLKPQEFYFHCMAGREGLIDTAVKTSRSGYLQRCLIKHLEGIQVHYDHTVRGADAAVYQFLYGEDGLDVTKQMHLTQFAFNLKNNQSLASKFAARALAGAVDEEEAADHMKKILKKKKKHPERVLPDPTLSQFMPSRYLGATSERFAEKVEDYVAQNKNHLLIVKGQLNQRQTVKPTQSSKLFRSLMSVRYMRSLVEPGEAVGLLASQGVGEPSTQMTLNTFHFAGHGAANVTLGIPRLREIVMTAAVHPKTPMIQLPIRKGTPLSEVERFCQQSSRLNLSHLVQHIVVTECLRNHHDVRVKVFTINIRFFPWKECREVHYVNSAEIVNAITALAAILGRDIKMEYKRLEADLKGQVANIGKGKAVNQDRDANEEEPIDNEKKDHEASEVGDGDADEEKRKAQGQEQTTYDEEEGDDPEENEEEDRIPDDDAIEAGTDNESEGTPSEDDRMDLDAAQWKIQREEVQEAFASALPLVSDSLTFDEEDGLKFDLEYDVQLPKIFLVDVLERACNKCIVNDVQGISKCHPPPKSHRGIVDGIVSGDAEIVVEGTNLRTMAYLAEQIVDIDQIKSNNIHAVLTTYGVEAARATIVQEIASVFALYSINVNVRHLMLIADYMTFDGGFKPFNRRGISTHSSPLLKASFETTAAVLSDATLYGDYDNLTTPSGNIVVGRPAMSGTGAFDVILPL